jgi:hypothetical protein
MCHGHAHHARWEGRHHHGPHPFMILVGLFIVFTIFKSGIWIPLMAVGFLVWATQHHHMEWGGGWQEKHKHGDWQEKRKHGDWQPEKRKHDDDGYI